MVSLSKRWIVYFGLVLSWLCVCLAKDKIQIGVFFNEDQEDIPYWEVIKENLEEHFEIAVPSRHLVPKDIFGSTKKLCEFLEATKEERIVAVLGPKTPSISLALESICSYVKIPYFVTSWRPKAVQPNSNVFSLYPDAALLSKALAKVVESFDWSGFAVLYEDDEGLLRLQDILKLQQYNEENKKNDIILHKLEIGGDNRPVLKSVRSSTFNRIILDVHVDRLMDIFRQAQEVNLLSDFSRSIFLTSLDAHTLDFAPLQTPVNITTVRLFDPSALHFQRIISDYFPDKAPNQIRVETALTFDALSLISEALNQIKSRGEEFGVSDLSCDRKVDDDLDIIAVLQETELSDALSGPVSLQNAIRDKFTLEVIEIDMKEMTGKLIGIWNSENPERIRLTRNETEREAELQRRLENHNFTVTSRIGPPYLFENKQPDAYKNARYYGFSMDLITEIAKLMNITFEFRITEGNSYVNLVNDLVERRADLGICDFTITPQRREVIDFSMPFMNLGIGILHKETTAVEVDNLYAFMRPISPKVWIYMWALSLASSMTMFLVARMAQGEWEKAKPWDPECKELENIWTLKNFFWLSLGSLTAQGCDILPKSVPTRIIAASWWVFALIIGSSYTANLAAFLTMQKRDVTIDSVEELAAQSKVKYGLMARGSTETFFSTSNNSLYQKMWNTMKNEKEVFEKDNPSGVERVLSTKDGQYAYFMESTGIEYELERKCDLRKIGGLLDSKSYGIGMPLNADYRHAINSAVLHLQESGKLMELKEKWWKKEREGEPCDRSIEEQSDALDLSNVGGIFIVLAVGIGMAYIIAIVEFLWNVWSLSVQEHLTYMETLKCEIKFACNIFTKKKRVKPQPSETSSSSSVKSYPNADQLNYARNMFNKSVSLLNFNGGPENELRNRQKSPSRFSRAPSNHLRVNN